jgi:creatinine amidohydrolase
MRWMETSWPQFEPVGPEQVIVWPLASCEQHGHHLPVGTDTILVDEIAGRMEKALPETVVLLPTLWLGASNHHRGFPGTVSISESLYSTVLQETLRGIIDGPVCAEGKVKRIFLRNGHGGNIYPGNSAITELAYAYRDRPDIVIGFSSYWTITEQAMATVKMDTDRLTHSCEYETSMMLAARGDLVDMSRASAPEVRWQGTRFTPDASRTSAVSVAAPFHARSANGALGKPELSTEEKGAALLDAIAADLVEFVQEMVQWPDLSDAREHTK